MIISDAIVEQAHAAFLSARGGAPGMRAALEAVGPLLEAQATADTADVLEERLRVMLHDLENAAEMVPAAKVMEKVRAYTTMARNRAVLMFNSHKPTRDKRFDRDTETFAPVQQQFSPKDVPVQRPTGAPVSHAAPTSIPTPAAVPDPVPAAAAIPDPVIPPPPPPFG